MKVTEEGIKEYQLLVKRKHGMCIPYKEACKQFSDLLILFKTIYRPIEKKKLLFLDKNDV